MKKYHFAIFATNIIALVLSISFIRAYRIRNISILMPFLALFIFLIAFLVVAWILKPGNVKSLIPSTKFLIFNLVLALIISLLFLQQIGFLGVLFAVIASVLLFEIEHILYERVKE